MAIPALTILAGCAGNPAQTDPLITVLTKVNNAGLSGLQSVINIAQVPNPGLPGGVEDQDGLTCAQKGGVPVFTQTGAVLAAAGKQPGPLGYAEMASLILPNTVQYNQAQNTLASACVAKANDVLGAAGVLAAGGVVGAMAVNQQILPLIAAVPK